MAVESQLGPDDVFLINSTSGTTGLPKCVVHTQNRWHYFHQKAVANGLLTPDDVFLPVIPMPFGFGIWTSHTTPIYLGATAVILQRFTATAACEAIARHKVTVLCCVSTQLTMLMADRACRDYDLSSLRVVFAGGEALPYRPAAEFEELTGAKILQFYGSNETGLLSGTTLDDSRNAGSAPVVGSSRRCRFDSSTAIEDVTETGRGQPACRGPATSLGYLGGTDHDKLFTRDGWMRMGDICEIDADGYLSVTGRTSDFILRGGKNISAAQVEDAVMTHPAIAVAAAVAMPDPVFGEKVCLYAELADSHDIDLPELVEAPAGTGSFQGTAARTTHRGRRTTPIVRRQRSPKASSARIFESGWRPIMNAPNARRGGLEVWAPSVVPPIGVELSNEQALAVAFRHLAGDRIRREHGRTHHLAARRANGHVRQSVGTVVARTHRVGHLRGGRDARVVRGRWDVTPAIHIHTELHRVRDDARVVIHNHPYYVCVLAALGRLPELVHQTGSLFLDDLCLVDTYDGEIDSPARAADLAAHIGRRQPDDSGQPRRHRNRPQPGRSGLPRGIDRTGMQAGL